MGFANWLTAFGIEAPVSFLGDHRPGSPLGGEGLAGPQFLAQLVVNVPGVYTGAVGRSVPFRSGTFRGSIAPHEVIVPMDGQKDDVQVWMVAWAVELEMTAEEVFDLPGAFRGVSNTLTLRPAVSPSGAVVPLIGLQSFSIQPIPCCGP